MLQGIFPEFDKEWNDLDPFTSPLLAEHGKIKNRQMRLAFDIARRRAYGVDEAERIEAEMEERDSSGGNAVIVEAAARMDRLLATVNVAALPFHHLISFKRLAPAFDSVPAKEKKTSPSLNQPMNVMSPQERRDSFRRLLSENGESENKAQLLDVPLGCHFTDYSGDIPFEADWYVLSRDSLEGCAEIYLAEMFLVKRAVYEAGGNLRSGFELRGADLTSYSPLESFTTVFAETFDQLFLNNLASSFTLNVTGGTKDTEDDEIKNRTAENQAIEKPVKTAGQFSKDLSRCVTRLGNRVESRMSMDGQNESVEEDGEYEDATGGQTTGSGKNADGNQNDGNDENDEGYENADVIHRFRLSAYWLDWQKAARLSNFDFDYLQTLTDARIVRFYELTKLRRVSSATQADGSLPDTLEIEYETFAALMPLPVLHAEQEVKRQIGSLIEPLKSGNGYVGSFAVEAAQPGTADAGATLKFRFND